MDAKGRLPDLLASTWLPPAVYHSPEHGDSEIYYKTWGFAIYRTSYYRLDPGDEQVAARLKTAFFLDQHSDPAHLKDKSMAELRYSQDGPSTSIRVHDAGTDGVLAQSCSSILNADEVIDFSDIDNMGFGNFTVGDKTFAASSHPELSGGLVCVKVYNDNEAIVECSGIQWDSSSAEIDNSCIGKRSAAHDSALPPRPGQIPSSDEIEALSATSPAEGEVVKKRLAKKQIICTSGNEAVRVGDGNPHQNYYHMQISENAFCGTAPSCSAGYEETTSYTIGFTAEISADGWTSAGFNVQKTWETGNQYTCYGGAGDTACVWYNTAHTAYTVKNVHYDSCLGSSDRSDPYVMWSPNQDNVGGGYYCVVGTCRNINARYWDYSGRAGGP
ncbi:hypothetical protein LIA77_09114 [Sarocladium implicatum]|nr:hypothetical protein LIA77_09114 [Sarocladium implicatum]